MASHHRRGVRLRHLGRSDADTDAGRIPHARPADRREQLLVFNNLGDVLAGVAASLPGGPTIRPTLLVGGGMTLQWHYATGKPTALVLYAELTGRDPHGAAATIDGHPYSRREGIVDLTQTVTLVSLPQERAARLQDVAAAVTKR